MKTFKFHFQKHSLREKLIEGLFNASLKPYQWLRRNRESWNMPKSQLLKMPSGTLGHDIGEFLEKNNFTVIDKCESHDVYHVLLEYSTDVPNEIKMQYFLLGNGRTSWYTIITILIGAVILPEHICDFVQNFIKGYHAFSIKQWDLRQLLLKKTVILRESIFRPKQQRMPSNFLKFRDFIMKTSMLYKRMDALRDKILSNLVKLLNPIYKTVMPHNRSWKLTKPQLRTFPQGTLGKDLADFIDKNNFDMLPYLETHDVYHVLLGYQPTIVEEARLYFFLLGNGKRSFEVINTVLVSLFLLPDYWGDLFHHYRRGQTCNKMAHKDFRYLMHENTEILRGIIFNKDFF